MALVHQKSDNEQYIKDEHVYGTDCEKEAIANEGEAEESAQE